MSFLSFLRKISNKEKEIFISEERFFSLLEKVSAFDEVRQWTENSGAYYPLLECRRLTDIEDVRKSEDILNRLEFIDRRFREFISIMSEYNRNDKSKDKWEKELSEYPPEKIYQVRREGDHLSLKITVMILLWTEIPPWLRCRLLSAENALLRTKWMSYMLCLKD